MTEAGRILAEAASRLLRAMDSEPTDRVTKRGEALAIARARVQATRRELAALSGKAVQS